MMIKRLTLNRLVRFSEKNCYDILDQLSLKMQWLYKYTDTGIILQIYLYGFQECLNNHMKYRIILFVENVRNIFHFYHYSFEITVTT